MNDSQQLFTQMYQNMQNAQGAQGAGPDMGGQNNAGNNDDVVDGDYREV
jgi:molecular chaperone DnaK